MNKKILKKALCLILVMSCISTWAQNSNKDIFYHKDLLGKKWVMYKNGYENPVAIPKSEFEIKTDTGVMKYDIYFYNGKKKK